MIKQVSPNLFLFILSTLNPFLFRKRSFFLADSRRSLPHLLVESISIHNERCAIKKSMLYGPTGHCISNLTPCFSNIFLKAISCGKRFLEKTSFMVCARLMACFLYLIGLSPFMRSLLRLAHSEFSFVSPVAQCLWCLWRLIADSVRFIVFMPKALAFLYIVSLETLHCWLNSNKDRPCSQWSFSITDLKLMPKYNSILLTALIIDALIVRGGLCQE